jgi:hypothetical protein
VRGVTPASVWTDVKEVSVSDESRLKRQLVQ